MNFETLALQIGRNIKSFRKTLGLSQSEACKRVGCDKRFYQRIEAGKAGLTLRTLLKISLALGIPLSDLLRESPEPILSEVSKKTEEVG